MANPRKFSEKIALLNQKQAQETAAFEAIMREVSDVTSRVASASSSVGASPTGSGVPETPLSVKSAGASPPQSSGKHLHINLGNQFRAGGSLPNVNNNANCGGDAKEHSSPHTGAIHSIDLKTALSNLEEMQHNSMVYRSDNRSRSMGVGPMRSRPMEKRHDTSPYSGVPYLSPPPPDTWRRTNSDSALHQSANEACQSTSAIPHRRDQHAMTGSGSDNRDSHHSFIERPRSSCEMPRVPGINIYPSSQPPGQQIPIGNNTGSLPDLSNVHFPSPIHTPLDQEDHSSSTPFSNSPQTSSPTNLSPTSLAQAGRLSFSQDHNPSSVQQGVALENSTSTSQQDLQSYPQQPAPTATSHSPTSHYIYQQPHSPVPPQSPKTSQSQQQQQQQQQHQQPPQQLNSLGSYRSTQSVNRPSPQSSPSLTVQGSPLSYSNNPSAPSSPTGHPGPPNLTSDAIDQNTYFMSQAQAASLQQDFEQFTMGLEWPKFAQQLMELGCTWTTQIEMDTPVQASTIGTYIGSPNHTANFTQNDVINVGGELGSGDTSYFSTNPQMAYQPPTTTTTATQQLTPQTPNTPTIILTDFSAPDDLTNPEFVKDLGTAMMGDFDPEMFPSDDALRQGLDPIDVDGLQMLADPTMVISDSSAEAHFRLDRL
ncbi:CREB-regulated transcription coactivator 1 isoform X3 [Harpegnathos saltator]|uniref:CREB-regulated transcription coactivator 1 isoform X3 n=1 Tax=Harpegnathos saltator TaxID=610380 RepID=UPI000DBED8AA|nr:CREB-regulated transcription coactivator 1 isoform X3 [Harpegnathos saltator]